jgi:ADP-ribosylglycohydrolase
LDEIRPSYCFDETSPGTVPQAITAFLESDDYEDAIQKAISLGGDADTLAAITESIAEASYGGVPPNFIGQVRKLVPVELWNLIEEYRQKYLLLGIHPPE